MGFWDQLGLFFINKDMTENANFLKKSASWLESGCHTAEDTEGYQQERV